MPRSVVETSLVLTRLSLSRSSAVARGDILVGTAITIVTLLNVMLQPRAQRHIQIQRSQLGKRQRISNHLIIS